MYVYRTEIHAGMHKTHHFEIKNAKLFWGGDTPSPDPRRLRCLDLPAYGAQAQRDTPEKNPSYGLGATVADIYVPKKNWT